MRISLRELMIVVAVVAVGLAGLKFPSTAMKPLVQAMAGAFLLGSLVCAVVDRGRRQAFAIGFVIWAAGYAAAAQWSDKIDWIEASSIESAFQPTKWLVALGRFHHWVDVTTGQPLTFDPTRPAAQPDSTQSEEAADEKGNEAASESNLLGPVQIQYLPPGNSVILGGRREMLVDSSYELLAQKTLTEEQIANAMLSAANHKTQYAYQLVRWPIDFVLVGHCLGMIVAGFFGGHFASYVRGRRLKSGRGASQP